ncbi:MAG: glycerol acyltransferase [Bacteroidales bacterium]|nr:glycerol acyltransferase [Bacteroidales bacterium]
MQQANNENESVVSKEFINLEKILAAKGVKVPRLVIRFLNRLLHVKELNEGIYLHRDKYGTDFAVAILDYLNIKVEMLHPERIPADGAPIIVGNHPLGGPDGMALIAAVGERRTDILFPVNDFLMYLPGLRPVFVPVDKVHGNRTTASAINEAFAGQNALLYFPAGLCSRRIKGKIVDLEWKPTVIKKAVLHHRDIVPVYIDARNRRRFYTIANIRKRLGVKFNFEMALLPGEMFAQSGNTFRMVVGNPIPWQTFDDGTAPAVWAQRLHDFVYRLAENNNAEL